MSEKPEPKLDPDLVKLMSECLTAAAQLRATDVRSYPVLAAAMFRAQIDIELALREDDVSVTEILRVPTPGAYARDQEQEASLSSR